MKEALEGKPPDSVSQPLILDLRERSEEIDWSRPLCECQEGREQGFKQYLRRPKKKSRIWIAGPASDWIIPYRCNGWFLLAHLYLTILVIYASVFWKPSSDGNALVGLMALATFATFASTEFGRGTVRTYRRTRQVIETNLSVALRAQRKIATKTYCVRAGARTAFKDFGLAHELIPSLANRWKPY